MCFYNIGLWCNFTARSLSKFKSCYHRCVKAFFGYDRYASVTGMLFDVGLPSFDTIMLNSKCSFCVQCEATDNLLVRHFISFGL